MTIHIATATNTDRAQAVVDNIDAGSGPGKLLIYGDTAPANANTAITTQTLLLELVLQDPCGTVSGSVLTFDVTPAISDDALDTEAATFGRFVDSDGNVVLQGDVGSDITMTDTTLESGQTVTVVSATLTEPT